MSVCTSLLVCTSRVLLVKHAMSVCMSLLVRACVAYEGHACHAMSACTCEGHVYVLEHITCACTYVGLAWPEVHVFVASTCQNHVRCFVSHRSSDDPRAYGSYNSFDGS